MQLGTVMIPAERLDAAARDTRDWCDLVRIHFPDGKGLLGVLVGFFDESEESGLLCVCGYLFEPDQAIRYATKMQALVGPRGPFHMVDVVARRERYEGISTEESDHLISEAVSAIQSHSLVGFSVSCFVDEVKFFLPRKKPGLRHPYSLCCHALMIIAGRWAREHGRTDGINYEFEIGGPMWRDANKLMDVAHSCPKVRDLYMHRGHSFQEKDRSPGLQAADTLAWSWRRFMVSDLIKYRLRLRADLARLVFGVARERNLMSHLGGIPLQTLCEHFGSPDFTCGCDEADHLSLLR